MCLQALNTSAFYFIVALYNKYIKFLIYLYFGPAILNALWQSMVLIRTPSFESSLQVLNLVDSYLKA